jgi:hypothetical protein
MATAPNSTIFYVYALARPIKKEYQIFYIGKGTKRRVFAHEADARGGHNCHKCNAIRKVWREGGEIQRYILLTTEDEQEAFDYEKEMIALHGRGNLCNQTDGGEGPSGRVAPPEEIERRKTRVASEETRRKMSVAQKGRKGPWLGLTHSEETKQRMSESQKRVQDTPEIREKRSQQLKRRWADPEWKAKNLESMKQGYQGKRTFTLRAPDGTIYTTDNLTQFCKDHALNYGTMHSVLWEKGRHKSYRGWTNA